MSQAKTVFARYPWNILEGLPTLSVDERMPKNEIAMISYRRAEDGTLKPQVVRITNIGLPETGT